MIRWKLVHLINFKMVALNGAFVNLLKTKSITSDVVWQIYFIANIRYARKALYIQPADQDLLRKYMIGISGLHAPSLGPHVLHVVVFAAHVMRAHPDISFNQSGGNSSTHRVQSRTQTCYSSKSRVLLYIFAYMHFEARQFRKRMQASAVARKTILCP